MWVAVLVNLVFAALASLFATKSEEPKASTLSDFDVPVTKEGQEIGKPYGTPWITAPQIVWFGDLKTIKIKDSQGKK